MSNYHYGDQSGCSSCSRDSGYRTMKTVCKTNQLPQCMDRYNSQRSSKDKMYYNFYVLGKPMNLAPDNALVKKWQSHTYYENSNL